MCDVERFILVLFMRRIEGRTNFISLYLLLVFLPTSHLEKHFQQLRVEGMMLLFHD
jgi:hypothetical protein